jgi:hypothetical protein
VASFLPILVVGPIADLIGTTWVLLLVALAIGLSGIASIALRGPLKPAETLVRAEVGRRDPIAAALRAEMPDRPEGDEDDDDDGEADGREVDEAEAAREPVQVQPSPVAGSTFTAGSEPIAGLEDDQPAESGR